MKYCLYFHINKSNSIVFYVGIGNKKRPYSKRSRSQFLKNIVSKYDYLIEVIHSDLSLDEACELEKHYIKIFGRLDIGSGSLVNLTDGGEGSTGYKHSDETKAKIKEQWSKRRGFDLPENIEEYQREYNRNYTKEYRKSEDVKEKYRESSRDRYHNMSDSEKEELRLKKKNYRDSLSDEKKQRHKEYMKKYRENMSVEQLEKQRKRNRENLRKKRLKDRNEKQL